MRDLVALLRSNGAVLLRHRRSSHQRWRLPSGVLVTIGPVNRMNQEVPREVIACVRRALGSPAA